jgi:RNA polymerase sigma-70 factor (ECF subfamily)
MIAMAFHTERHRQNLIAKSRNDPAAAIELIESHRDRLRAMVAVRLDRRLATRVDPSDVVQETLAEAHQRLPEYLQSSAIPFYPWLRSLAWRRLIQLYRRHIVSQARAVTREERWDGYLPDHSAQDLAERLTARGSSPSRRIQREEQKARVRAALARLEPRDREVLVLRYLEQLSLDETAAVLELSTEAAKSRQRRALERFAMFIERSTDGDVL